MARLAPTCPDQRGGPGRNTGVEAGGDPRLNKLTGDCLEYQWSRMGHQHAVEWRQRILRHGIPMPAAFRRLGLPILVLGGSLAAFLACAVGHL